MPESLQKRLDNKKVTKQSPRIEEGKQAKTQRQKAEKIKDEDFISAEQLNNINK